MGSSLQINFELVNQAKKTAALMVDFCIHFVKANGKTNPKVFKLKVFKLKVFKLKMVKLAPNQSPCFSKKVSLKAMTTRTSYSGCHKVEVIINGQNTLIGNFDLKK
jgi:hypothetical protein